MTGSAFRRSARSGQSRASRCSRRTTGRKVKKKGDKAVQDWIDSQLKGRSCLVVLIGSSTSGRKWVKYEMRKAWADGKGVVGIRIHALKNSKGLQASKGTNPLGEVTVDTKTGKKVLSTVAKTYDPPHTTSKGAYNHIRDNIDAWIEKAIEIRKAN